MKDPMLVNVNAAELQFGVNGEEVDNSDAHIRGNRPSGRKELAWGLKRTTALLIVHLRNMKSNRKPSNEYNCLRGKAEERPSTNMLDKRVSVVRRLK